MYIRVHTRVSITNYVAVLCVVGHPDLGYTASLMVDVVVWIWIFGGMMTGGTRIRRKQSCPNPTFLPQIYHRGHCVLRGLGAEFWITVKGLLLLLEPMS